MAKKLILANLVLCAIGFNLIEGFRATPVAKCNPVGVCKSCSNCKHCGHCSQKGNSCSVCIGKKPSN